MSITKLLAFILLAALFAYVVYMFGYMIGNRDGKQNITKYDEFKDDNKYP